MRVGVMVTNGGPHPADKWAEETAGEIMSLVKIEDDQAGDTDEVKENKRKARRVKLRLEADLVDALEPHHFDNQKREKDHLHASDERLNQPYDPEEDLIRAAVDSVVGAAKKYGDPWASAFDSDNGRELITTAVKVHFASAMHVERGWHCDHKIRNRDHNEHVLAFDAKR